MRQSLLVFFACRIDWLEMARNAQARNAAKKATGEEQQRLTVAVSTQSSLTNNLPKVTTTAIVMSMYGSILEDVCGCRMMMRRRRMWGTQRSPVG